MYKRVLLAYDGSLEGRMALREGALIARRYGADVFLLAIVPTTAVVDPIGTAVASLNEYDTILKDGLKRVTDLGLAATGELVQGEPTEAISVYAERFGVDLVIVGHIKRSLWSRLLSEPKPAALIDRLSCSLLISRNVISDEAFLEARREP
jgi:nucleotide-binding universal stress UspA family protein